MVSFRKEHRSFFKNFKIHQHAFVLAPQSSELIAFIACKRTSWTIARVDLGAANPIPKSRLPEVQVSCELYIFTVANLAKSGDFVSNTGQNIISELK